MVPGVGSRWPVLHSSQAVAVGSDGSIAEVTPDGWLGMYLGGHDFAPIQEDVGTVTGASIRPGGEQIVYTTSDGLFWVRVSGEHGPTTLVRPRSGELLSSPTWSPDGTRLAFVSTRNGNSALEMFEVTTQHVSTLRDGIVSVAWSPTENTIAAFGPNGAGLLLIDGSTGTTQTMDPSATSGTAPAWSPDGSRLAFLGPDGRATVIRPDGTILETDVHLPDVAPDSPLFWSPGASAP
jgi:dipeptidyl aminopeptidase/acylaminoacyl peptidase